MTKKSKGALASIYEISRPLDLRYWIGVDKKLEELVKARSVAEGQSDFCYQTNPQQLVSDIEGYLNKDSNLSSTLIKGTVKINGEWSIYQSVGNSAIQFFIAENSFLDKVSVNEDFKDNIKTMNISGPVTFPAKVITHALGRYGSLRKDNSNGQAIYDSYILEKKDDNHITFERITQLADNSLQYSPNLSFNIQNNEGIVCKVTEIKKLKDLSNSAESNKKENVVQRLISTGTKNKSLNSSGKKKVVTEARRAISFPPSSSLADECLVYAWVGDFTITLSVIGLRAASRVRVSEVFENNIKTIHISGPIVFSAKVLAPALDFDGKYIRDGDHEIIYDTYTIDKKDNNQITVKRVTQLEDNSLQDSPSLSFNIQTNKEISDSSTSKNTPKKENVLKKFASALTGKSKGNDNCFKKKLIEGDIRISKQFSI